MKIVIPGGTGQVGHVLARAFVAAGHEVVVLGRSANAASAAGWRVARWDGKSLGDWAAEVDGAEVVVNLAGRTVDCRYSAENRRQILESRVDSTRVLGEAIALAARPPRVWLQSSTATIYAHRYDAANDEATGLFSRAASRITARSGSSASKSPRPGSAPRSRRRHRAPARFSCARR